MKLHWPITVGWLTLKKKAIKRAPMYTDSWLSAVTAALRGFRHLKGATQAGARSRQQQRQNFITISRIRRLLQHQLGKRALLPQPQLPPGKEEGKAETTPSVITVFPNEEICIGGVKLRTRKLHT